MVNTKEFETMLLLKYMNNTFHSLNTLKFLSDKIKELSNELEQFKYQVDHLVGSKDFPFNFESKLAQEIFSGDADSIVLQSQYAKKLQNEDQEVVDAAFKEIERAIGDLSNKHVFANELMEIAEDLKDFTRSINNRIEEDLIDGSSDLLDDLKEFDHLGWL